MARNFDGVDDLVNAGSPGSLDDQEPYTMAAWVFLETSGGSGAARLLTKGSGNDGIFELHLVTGTPFAPQFDKDYTTTDLSRTAVADSVVTGKWQHWAASWDGGTGFTGVLLYVDGVQTAYVTSANSSGTKRSEAARNFVIGNRSNANRPHDGEMAYVTFHSRVLDGNEIQALMRYPGSLHTERMKGCWPLWTPGGTEMDYTTFNNSATVTGAVATASSPPVCGLFYAPSPQPTGGM